MNDDSVRQRQVLEKHLARLRDLNDDELVEEFRRAMKRWLDAGGRDAPYDLTSGARDADGKAEEWKERLATDAGVTNPSHSSHNPVIARQMLIAHVASMLEGMERACRRCGAPTPPWRNHHSCVCGICGQGFSHGDYRQDTIFEDHDRPAGKRAVHLSCYTFDLGRRVKALERRQRGDAGKPP